MLMIASLLLALIIPAKNIASHSKEADARDCVTMRFGLTSSGSKPIGLLAPTPLTMSGTPAQASAGKPITSVLARISYDSATDDHQPAAADAATSPEKSPSQPSAPDEDRPLSRPTTLITPAERAGAEDDVIAFEDDEASPAAGTIMSQEEQLIQARFTEVHIKLEEQQNPWIQGFFGPGKRSTETALAYVKRITDQGLLGATCQDGYKNDASILERISQALVQGCKSLSDCTQKQEIDLRRFLELQQNELENMIAIQRAALSAFISGQRDEFQKRLSDASLPVAIAETIPGAKNCFNRPHMVSTLRQTKANFDDQRLLTAALKKAQEAQQTRIFDCLMEVSAITKNSNLRREEAFETLYTRLQKTDPNPGDLPSITDKR